MNGKCSICYGHLHHGKTDIKIKGCGPVRAPDDIITLCPWCEIIVARAICNLMEAGNRALRIERERTGRDGEE